MIMIEKSLVKIIMDHPGAVFTRPILLRNTRMLSPGVIKEEISIQH